MSADRLAVLGVRIDPVTVDGVLAETARFASSGKPHQIITANALMILAAEKSPALARAFDEAALVVPDSAGVALAARLQGRPLPETTPGVELVDHLCGLAAEKGWSVYLLGAAPGVAETAAQALKNRHAGLRVAGTRDGYFSEAEEPAVLEAVAAAAPHFLFVALAVPRQDVWIHRNLGRFNCRLAMGVGGSFDVLAGRLPRAPRWMRKAGLEWLFRLLRQPSRARRMAGLPVFLLKAMFASRRPAV